MPPAGEQYPVKETHGCWKKPIPKRRKSTAGVPGQPNGGGGGGGRSPRSRPKPQRSLTGSWKSTSVVAPGDELLEETTAASPAPSATFGGARASTRSIAKANRMQEVWPGWACAQQVLLRMVDGYGRNLEVRRDLTNLHASSSGSSSGDGAVSGRSSMGDGGGGGGGGGSGRIAPNFTDLTMWSVLAGQHELAAVRRHRQNDRLGEATAGHRRLIRLHPTA